MKIHSKVNCYVGFDRQKKYKSLENRYEQKIWKNKIKKNIWKLYYNSCPVRWKLNNSGTVCPSAECLTVLETRRRAGVDAIITFKLSTGV